MLSEHVHPHHAVSGVVTMNTKGLLILVTVIAVVSDSMLIPFYPQYFEEVFGVYHAQYVGYYVGATCLTVMAVFPLWAVVAKNIPPLQLLIYTQLGAGLLSVLCYWVMSLPTFLVLSLLMFGFKASYLLVYPYVMSLESKEHHVGTIGLLAVVVHLGGIFGAVLSGLMFQIFKPRDIFLVMAACDVVQALMCVHVLQVSKSVPGEQATRDPAQAEALPADHLPAGSPATFIYRLGVVMFFFYLSAFMSRPFFTQHWEVVSASENKVISGFVFAIPGIVALIGLWFAKRRRREHVGSPVMTGALCAGLLGCLLQFSMNELGVIMGRILLGWAMFQGAVSLDLVLFQRSASASYAMDFSKIHIFQQLGVLVSSFAAGWLVASHGLRMPFLISAIGFLIAVFAFRQLLPTSDEQAVGKNGIGGVVNRYSHHS